MVWHIPSSIVGSSGFEVDVLSNPDLFLNCCEFNVDRYVEQFGGEKIQGCYLLKHNELEIYQLVKHYIVKQDDYYFDVTPFGDQRTHNYFLPVHLPTYNLFTRSLNSINKVQETELMYYVYCYIDPETKLPFYVGKGKQNRAYVHIMEPRNSSKNKNKTRFKNKIESMKARGIEPEIIFLAQNIQDEKIAYEIEESYIKQYGRKGYDTDGILLNICMSSKPPNHRGRTYEEIYGVEGAEYQKKMRSKLQELAGGYGPEKHTEQTRKKISESITGDKNPMWGKHHTQQTIRKIIENRDMPTGKDHYLSKCYRLTSPTQKSYILYGGELKEFCLLNNLSQSTLKKQIATPPSAIPKYGKTAGWKLEVI